MVEDAEVDKAANSTAELAKTETPTPDAGAAPAAPTLTVDSAEIKALAKESGISPEAALAIQLGQTTLKRALNKVKNRGELYNIVREHRIPHSLAGQVLKQQMTVEEACTRARVIAHRQQHRNHCSFQAALDSGEPYIFGLHGQKVAKVKVLENLKYDVKLEMEGEESVIPKHNIKYLYRPEHRKTVNKMLKLEKSLAANPRGPITKVAERFRLKDDTLQKVLDLKSHLNVTLLEGEKLSAELRYYAQYEIILGLKADVELSIFRHAIASAEIVPLEEVLAAERYAKKMQKKAQGKKKKKRH